MLELPMSFTGVLFQYLICYWMIGLQGNFIFIVLASFGLGAGSAGLAASEGTTAPRAASGDAKADARRRASFGGGALRK